MSRLNPVDKKGGGNFSFSALPDCIDQIRGMLEKEFLGPGSRGQWTVSGTPGRDVMLSSGRGASETARLFVHCLRDEDREPFVIAIECGDEMKMCESPWSALAALPACIDYIWCEYFRRRLRRGLRRSHHGVGERWHWLQLGLSRQLSPPSDDEARGLYRRFN